ncbi:MAG: hypothetical protein WAL10_26245 [Acetobacteraceae bacterium]|jgi:hypothetical protein
MSLIATCVEHSGVARIFFDLRPADRSLEEERRIAAAIERALELAAMESEPVGTTIGK